MDQSHKDAKRYVLKELERLTSHSFIELTNRANAAILAALTSLSSSTDLVLYPQDGGWLTYPVYAKQLGKETLAVNTHLASIDLDDLKDQLEIAQRRNKRCVFIYHSLGAYSVSQDIIGIYKLCQEYNCLVIMDVSGSIGTSLCDGKVADIMLGSFGHWKPLNFGSGGFISCKTQELYKQVKPLLSASTFYGNCKELLLKFHSLEQHRKYLETKRQEVVLALADKEIIHRDQKHALVVLLRWRSELDRLAIIGYCTKNSLEYTDCPREIRILEDAISIEVKRLEETE